MSRCQPLALAFPACPHTAATSPTWVRAASRLLSLFSSESGMKPLMPPEMAVAGQDTAVRHTSLGCSPWNPSWG